MDFDGGDGEIVQIFVLWNNKEVLFVFTVSALSLSRGYFKDQKIKMIDCEEINKEEVIPNA